MITGAIRIAVDIGGTFTDLQIFEEAHGHRHAFKTPTTPEDPSLGLITGIEAAARFGFSLSQIDTVMHGTTISPS